MFKWTILALTLFIGAAGADTKIGLYGSLLYNVPEFSDLDGTVDEKSHFGFGAGVRALMGLNDRLYFRSGAGFAYKKVGVDVTDSGPKQETALSYVYLNIPATLYLKTGPVGIFGGTALNARLNDECDTDPGNCQIKNPKSIVLPLIIGFDFIFNDAISLEVAYEGGIMETSKNTKISSAVMSLVYTFQE